MNSSPWPSLRGAALFCRLRAIADNQRELKMPELPEVETVCRSLRPHLVGRTIARVEVLEPRLRMPVDRRALHRLAGRRIEHIVRTAKYILLHVSGGIVWMFHLGMSGKLICVKAESARRKHDHIIVRLHNDAEIRYHDSRRFGFSVVCRREHLLELPQLRDVGIDPFDPRLTADYLFSFTRGSM